MKTAALAQAKAPKGDHSAGPTSAPASTPPAPRAPTGMTAMSGAAIVQAASGVFKLPVPIKSIIHVDILDVDLVLTTADGQKIVLQGGALDAFSGESYVIQFADGQTALSEVAASAGEVKIDTTTLSAHSSPTVTSPSTPSDSTAENDASDGKAEASQHQAQAQSPAPGQVGPAPPSYQSPPQQVLVQHAFDAPPARASPQVPVHTGDSRLSVDIRAKTGAQLANGVLTGFFGATGADSNPSAVAQMAPDQITTATPGLIVQANALGGQQFDKLIHIGFSGTGTVSSLSLSGVPAGYTIVGATPDASGVYTLNPAAFLESNSANTGSAFDIPIQYKLSSPNAAQPTHDSFNVTVSLTTSGVQSATYSNTYTVVVIDATSAADLTTAQVGENILVLPAQGIGYQIQATASDTITGGRNNDTIYGGGSNLGAGGNVLDGALGTNTLDYSKAQGPETINATIGQAFGASGVDTIANFQDFIGTSYNDLLIGSTTTLSLAAGGPGSNDTFESGGGGTTATPESITGSTFGANTLSYADAPGGVNVDLTKGMATGFGVQAISNIQILIGSYHDDTLRGATTTRKIQAGGVNSNDLIDPGGGGIATAYESIVGSAAGLTTLTYANATQGVTVNLLSETATGYGFQTLSNIEVVIGSKFNDDLIGNLNTVALEGGAGGQDTFDGGGAGTAVAPESIVGSNSGANTLTFANAPGGVSVNLTVGFATGAYGVETISGIQNVIGSGYSDFLVGSNSTRTLEGGLGGNDTFDGAGGGTVAAPESIIGSATGINVVTYANSPTGVTVNLQAGTETGYGIQSLTAIQEVVGSAYADSLKGARTTLSLFGGSGGADTFDGGGAGTKDKPESISGSLGGPNTLTFAADTIGSLKADLTNGFVDAGGASGYGYETVSNIQRLIGSAQGNDYLIGGQGVQYMAAGASTASDTFESGGGGTSSAPETIVGASAAISTLTFANDKFGAISANLVSGLIDAGGVYAYGFVHAQNIQRLIGTAQGGDTLRGGPGVIYIAAGSDTASDTFDGGGGGSIFQQETIVGSTGGTNTLTFAADTAVSGGVNVNLQSGVVSGAYGDEYVSNIHHLIGSAFGADVLIGDNSGDTIEAGGGNTLIVSGSGNNTLKGGIGADTISALLGNNLIDGGGGNTSIISGTGNNTLTFVNAKGGVNVNLLTGVATGYGTETLQGSFQKLIGSTHDDYLTGSTATLAIQSGGSLSNDTFDGGGGGTLVTPQTIVGSANGVNTLTLANAPSGGVSVDLASGIINAGGASGYGYAKVSNIEKVIGTTFGHDTLKGTLSTLLLQAGGDFASDTFDGGGGGNSVTPEVINGSKFGSNTLTFANDTVAGNNGSVVVNLLSGQVTGAYGYEHVSNISTVIGSSLGNDTLIGAVTGSDLQAGQGASSLQASGGLSTLSGGVGRDTLDGSVGMNLIDGGGGNASIIGSGVISATSSDTLTYANSNSAVQVNLLTGRASGYGAETITGQIAAIIGSAQSDSLVGSAFTQSISGGAGGDDSIDPGGGGTSLNPEQVFGGTGGSNLLTLVNDTVGGVNANLSSGLIDAGGASGYGFVKTTNIQRLIGSEAGGDTLTGGLTTRYLGAGSNLAVDTFDGGGGGTAQAIETIVGNLAGGSTLTFAADTSSAGGVNVDLASGVVTGGYGVEQVSNIHRVIGSASGSDILKGDNWAAGDYLQAGNGATKIIAGSGHNTLIGGHGSDTIDATNGVNLIDGGGGSTEILVGTGANTLTFAHATGAVNVDLTAGTVSGYGTETIIGGVANLVGSAFQDTLKGSTNTRSISASGTTASYTIDPGGGGTATSPEVITGSAYGVNTLTLAAASVGGAIADLSTGLINIGGVSGYGFDSVSNIEILIGTALGGDSLVGTLTTQKLVTGSQTASDTFDGGGGGTASAPEQILGSSLGNNTLSFASDTISGPAGGVLVDLQTDSVSGGWGDYILSNIENVIGSPLGNDTIKGNITSGINSLIQAGGGTDLIVAGTGLNTIIAGSGADIIDATVGTNLIIAGSGLATIYAGSTSLGGDTLSYVNSGSGVVVDLSAAQPGASLAGSATASQIINGAVTGLIGSAYSDTLIGSPSTLYLYGGSGGNDQFDIAGGGTTAHRVVVQGSDSGTANLLTFAADTVGPVTVNLQKGFADAGLYGYATISAIQELVGSAAGNDYLIGAPGVILIRAGSATVGDTIDGGGGGTVTARETIDGGSSGLSTLTFQADTLSTGGVSVNLGTGFVTGGYGVEYVTNIHRVIGSHLGADVIIGDSANDYLQAGGGSANITAGSGNNTLIGGSGTNTIVAGVGANLIDGGLGSTSIIGGSGEDTLTYANASQPINLNLLAENNGSYGTESGYGTETITGSIRAILGSIYNDTITGSTYTLLIQSGGSDSSDLFDAGGGGTAAGPESIIGSQYGQNTISYANATSGVVVDLYLKTATGDGYQYLKYITAVVGSPYADLLTGTTNTTSLYGGTGGDDTFFSGGGGTNASQAESITGSDTGTNLLSFAPDHFGSLNANLSTGYINAGGATKYGYVIATHIQELIGSAAGQDTLIGAPSTLLIQAGSSSASDTFDGGGGGTTSAIESIQGSANGANTLTFANDSVHAVNANLATGIVDGGGKNGYGFESVTGIQALIGSAIGGDSLTGSSTTTSISAGPNAMVGDTFDGGGGGTLTSREIITGSQTGINTLTFENDTVGHVYVDLGAGTVNAGAYGYESVSNIQALIGSKAGGDTLVGTTSTVKMSAANSTASDTFDGGGGGTAQNPELIYGSASGNNLLTFAADLNVGGAAIINLSAGTATATNYGVLRFSNIHNVIGSAYGDDQITGDSFGDSIKAGGGNSLITAVAGASASTPSNTLVGGGGSSQVVINAVVGSNLIDGGGGAATIDGANTVGGASASDTLTYAHATGGVTVNLLQGSESGYGLQSLVGGFVAILGSTHGDSILGSAQTLLIQSNGVNVNDTMDPGGGGTIAAPEVLNGSTQGLNTLTFGSSPNGVNVDMTSHTASGYGYQTFSNFEILNGSASNDTLRGAPTTVSIVGGGGNDIIDPGGGGSSTSTVTGAMETIVGNTTGSGDDTLTFVRDNVAAVTANLQTGIISAGGQTGYGDDSVTGIQNLIGSAIGGDYLTGAPTTKSLAAGSATASDTFDAGGGGTALHPESITGSSSGISTLTYAADNLGSISATLSATQAGTINAGAYGVQSTLQIQKLIGSAVGGDYLQGAATTLLLQSGSTIAGDTFDGGGGGASSLPGVIETITGSTVGVNVLTFAGDTVQGVKVDLLHGTVDGGGTAGYGFETVSNIQQVIGSRIGGDTLIGNAFTTALSASPFAVNGDTFDGGGGGTATNPEVITGSSVGINTLTFANDTLATEVNANLSDPSHPFVDAGGASGYGYLLVTNIQNLIGGAQADFLEGLKQTQFIAGGAGAGDTLVGGGGGQASAPETIIGGTGGGAIFDLTADTIAAAQIDLGTGLVNAGGPSGYGFYALQASYQSQSAPIVTILGSNFGSDTFYAATGASPIGVTSIQGAGNGTDVLSFQNISGSSNGVTVNLNAGNYVSGLATTSISSIHIVIGTQSGADNITGDTSNDSITAGSGATTITSGTGANTLVAGAGADSFVAIAGTNRIIAGTGTLRLSVTTGADTLDYSNQTGPLAATLGQFSAGVSIPGSGGVATVSGALAGIIGTVGNDTLTGSSATLYLSNEFGGNATFDGGGGGTSGHYETIKGSSTGQNLLTFANDTASGSVYVNLYTGSVSGSYGYETISGIHNIIGSQIGADTIIGDGSPDSLVAGGGNNISITSGNATLNGGNTIIGGLGRETINASAGSNLIILNGGNTSIVGGGSGTGDTLSFANDTVTGAGGGVSVNLITGQVTGAYGSDTVNGAIVKLIGSAAGNDTLIGTSATLTLQGGTGSDLFDGGGGGSSSNRESLIGSAGGNNTVSFANDTSSLGGVYVNLNAQTVNSNNGVYGYESLVGIHNVIGSLLGADTIIGDGSNDSIVAGGGTVLITTGVGANTVVGGAGAETITTGSGQNTIYAGTGNDSINASSGANLIIAGTGNSTAGTGNFTILAGSASGDTLSFANETTAGVVANLTTNVITGFATGGMTGSLAGVGASTVPTAVTGLIGGAGADSLTGSANTLYIYGGTGGGDTLDGSFGGTTLTAATLIGGGSGALANTLTLANDTLGHAAVTMPSTTAVIASGATIAANSGWGSVNAGNYGDFVLSNVQKLIGSAAGGDTLMGSTTTLAISAGPTMVGSLSDTFDGGGGGASTVAGVIETITGAAGLFNTLTFANDTVSAAGGGVNINLAAGVVTSTAYGNESVSGVYRIIGSASGNDTFIGDANSDQFIAGSGLDSITSGTGATTIYAGTGASTIVATSSALGSTLIYDGGGNISLTNSTLTSAGHMDTLSFANDTVSTGITAILTASGGSITGDGTVTLTNALYALIGSPFNDTLHGSTSTLYMAAGGTSSSDTFDGGGGGASTVAGVIETIIGSTGGTNWLTFAADTVSAAGNGGVNINLATSIVSSAHYGNELVSNIHNIIGSAYGNDTITADTSGDYINLAGSTGADLITGGTGAGTDTIVCGSGADTIHPGSNPELITTGATAISITGGMGADTINALAATSGVISGSTGGDSITVGTTFATAMIGGTASVKPSGGTNTLVLDWQASSASTTFNFSSISSAMNHINTLDLSGNTKAAGGVTYTITASQIEAMGTGQGSVLNVKLAAADTLVISLQSGSEFLASGSGGIEYINNSGGTHLAAIHVI